MICREKARILLAELIAFVLYPAQEKLSELLRQKNAKENNKNGGETHDKQSKNLNELVLQLYHSANNNEKRNIPWTLKRRMIIVRFLAKQIISDRYDMETLLDVNLVSFIFYDIAHLNFKAYSLCF